MNFISDLTNSFKANANSKFAAQMKAYMRNKFEFYGIKTQPRRELLKTVVATHRLEVRDTMRSLVFDLYDLPERELHHSAIELFEKQLRKTYKKEDIVLIERLITTNAWWDSVDFISKQILGNYLLKFPEETHEVISNFSNSENMWLNRCTITFQLGYKTKTNEALLFNQCLQHKSSEEFFIQKAIGWALREYGKTHPESVLKFVRSSDLKPLSTREAIRNIV